ncbi:MAG: hypothetical protein WC292_06610 [Clostridia bacterium]
MSTFSQYKSLLGIIIRNSLSFRKAEKSRQKNKQVAIKIGIGLAIFMIAMYAAVMAGILADTLAQQGLLGDFLYTILFGAQFIVLFFGAAAVMSYIFFSKDNALLTSLPLNPKAVFMAKFTMAYLSELLFSALILLPTLTTIGVLNFIRGYGLAWHFFLVELLAVALIPIIPLLIISLISMPLMYVISYLKKRAVGNGIAMAVLYIGIMMVYLFVVLGFSSTTGSAATPEGVLIPESTLNTFATIKKVTIFNYPLVEAFMNRSAALNLLIYVAALTVVLFAALGLVSLFYRRALNILSEGQGSSRKSKKKTQTVENNSLFRSFLLKEIRTLTHTPVLLMSTLSSIVLVPVMMFFMSFTMSMGAEELPNDMMVIASITFVAYLMSASTNQIAVIGFSREGKNLFVLKSLPISAKTIIDSKLLFAMCVTAISAITAGVMFPIASKNTSISAIIGLPLIVLFGGFNMNCTGLLNDLKNPNLTWNNVSELTRNNKRVLKPMMLALGLGFAYMFGGIFLAFQNALKGELLYFAYFGVCLLPLLILSFVSYKRLYASPDALLEKLEG